MGSTLITSVRGKCMYIALPQMWMAVGVIMKLLYLDLQVHRDTSAVVGSIYRKDKSIFLFCCISAHICYNPKEATVI